MSFEEKKKEELSVYYRCTLYEKGCVEQNVVAEIELFSSSDSDDKDMDKDYIQDEPMNSSSDEEKSPSLYQQNPQPACQERVSTHPNADSASPFRASGNRVSRNAWYFFFFQIPYLPELFIQLRDLRFLNVIFYTKKKVSPYNEEDKEAYRFTFAKPGALTPPINYYRANLMLNLMPDKNFLKSIPKDDKNLPPGLLLFGEKDIAIHVDSIIGTDRIIPNLSIEIIKDATHFVQDDPDAVNQLMQDFFVKLPKLKKEIEARE
ncbi:epoxide hydrolase 4-like [Lycorma delicatula]|uniref:epoxide hydrolase 4-like n=1 Tax=Lycorma delicatula TaxID=130591 RepID=UPI003F514FBF